ncbi:MAG TPA: aldo/keto reductase [Ruminococcaceae bacterium]|nr:aldo/keto reductase [Oscillospiraceae bacterium]
MQYRKFGQTGCEVSCLGFGSMRLPMMNKDEVDVARAVRMIRHAIDSGVNYLDTAYFYHGGESEKIVGEALKDGYREKTYIATKLPMGEVKTAEDFDRLLNTQLERLGTDHVDFYLFHALNAPHWETVKRLNLIEKMRQAKADGRIRHMGFSFHDNPEIFTRIVDEYDGCEFCQIQLNYLDTDHQAGMDGLKYAAEKGLGVVVMEPIRGGRLAEPSEEIRALLPAGRTPVENALAYLWDMEQVSLLLSGMSNFEQVTQNLESANRFGVGCLSPEEHEQFVAAKKAFDRSTVIPCTVCNYCQPCPKNVPIPQVFAAYNKVAEGGLHAVRAEMPDMEEVLSRCVKCGICEAKCPQQIQIVQHIKGILERF